MKYGPNTVSFYTLGQALVLSWTPHTAGALMHQPAPLLLKGRIKAAIFVNIGKEEKVDFHGIEICCCSIGYSN